LFELISLVNTNILGEREIEKLRLGAASAQRGIAEADDRVKEAGEEAADANAEAGDANERAGQANERASKAGREAAAANVRAGTLEIEAAKQREKAAAAEKALLEVQRRITPRLLSNDHFALLVDALKRSPAKGAVKVNSVFGDAEGAALASQLRRALEVAGWPPGGGGQGSYGNNPIGVHLVVHSAQSAPLYASALLTAFDLAGFPLVGAEAPTLPEETVVIIVGNKPP
jgi:hypothetical protein